MSINLYLIFIFLHFTYILLKWQFLSNALLLVYTNYIQTLHQKKYYIQTFNYILPHFYGHILENNVMISHSVDI